MIRQLTPHEISAIPSAPFSWQRFRIEILLHTYGLTHDFFRLYRQEESGGLLSVLDQNGILDLPDSADLSEWADFLPMLGLADLSLTGKGGNRLSQRLGGPTKSGSVMVCEAPSQTTASHLRIASTIDDYRLIYGILSHAFEMGEFEPWYCDLFARCKRGQAAFYQLREQGCAFATFNDDHLFLSAVAVLPECRGNGVGSEMLRGILSAHQGKSAAVFSRNASADRFYQRLGFTVSDHWLELQMK